MYGLWDLGATLMADPSNPGNQSEPGMVAYLVFLPFSHLSLFICFHPPTRFNTYLFCFLQPAVSSESHQRTKTSESGQLMKMQMKILRLSFKWYITRKSLHSLTVGLNFLHNPSTPCPLSPVWGQALLSFNLSRQKTFKSKMIAGQQLL